MASKQKASTGKKRGPSETSQEAYEKFAHAWNAAEKKSDVIKTTGLSEGKINAWSQRLRKHGVELKKFQRGNVSNIDFGAIKAVAKKALKA